MNTTNDCSTTSLQPHGAKVGILGRPLRLLSTLAFLSLLGGTSVADIQWDWAFATEAGYFITDGDLVGGAAPPATYNLIDFGVTQSVDPGAIGTMSSGFYSEGNQPGTGFVWDGTSDTMWFRSNGTWTNGTNLYKTPAYTDLQYLFEVNYYKLRDSNFVDLAFSTTLSLAPVGQGAPGTPYCFGDGTGGTCPCFVVGATGAGCPNSATGGAVLAGTGAANFSADTFGLAISGIPGAKAGLCVKGSTQLGGGNGNPVGEGLLCASPQLRSQVIMSDAGGNASMSSWRGQPFGTFPGTANVGAPTYYQWWYRDPANSCAGQGFNFTNAWDVTWM